MRSLLTTLAIIAKLFANVNSLFQKNSKFAKLFLLASCSNKKTAPMRMRLAVL